MENKNFTATIQVEQSPRQVFGSITDDVAKWWGGKDLNGKTTQLHDVFIIHHPGAHYSKQEVIEIIPDKKVVWLVTESKLEWLEKNKHEWTNTKMVFEIDTIGNKTVLQFTHEGLVPEKEGYARFSDGWNIVIKDWLLMFITTGQPHFNV